MKKSIMLGIVLVSGSAFAGATTSQQGIMTFTSEKSPTCTLDVIKHEAPIVFSDMDLHKEENYTKAIVKSDVATTAVVDIQASWSDTSAWGGSEPTTTFHTIMNDDGDGFYGLNGQVKYKIHKNNQDNVLEVAAQADRMTHAGVGRIDAVVQVSCE